MATDASNPTIIDLCQNKFLVWHPVHVLTLRKHHRIIGVCVGSLPWKPRQNVQNSLPLRLNKLETVFLIRRGIAKLRNGNDFPANVFSSARKHDTHRARVAQRQAQISVLQEQKSEQLDAMSSSILRGKQAKKKKLNTNSKQSDASNIVTEPQYFEKFKESELKKTDQLKGDQTWVEMGIASKFADILPLMKDFDFELNEEESLHLEVFCDLHDQGFFITNGNKFGGHFLVYPGDPVAYHSFYIAICVPHKRKISGCEYSAYGRLASTVKKTLLICSKTEKDEINYLSMSWTGIVT